MIRADRRILMALGALGLALALGSAYRAGVLPGFGGGEKPAAVEEEVPVRRAVARARQDVPVTIDASARFRR
ncbi:hypothetical protein [Methylocystis parvus]|uniref:hypothetical protein n=1 Tax=Methylocystis parvus TaxID=134 RepID=UPI003C76A789